MLFQLLDPLVDDRDVRSLDRGAILFRRGDRASHLYTVRAGALQLRRCTVDGREVPMAHASGGDTLCEAALTSERYHCDGIAVAPSLVGPVRKQRVLALLRAEPDFAVALAAAMADTIRRTRTRLELRSIKRAGERIIHYLAAHADDAGEVRVGSTYKELAAELGLTHESLYRELARLERGGSIARRGTSVRLLARV